MDVLGDDDYMAGVVGYTDDGEPIIVGARPRRGAAGRIMRPHSMVHVNRPPWRDTQLAPGVVAPDQGLLPLPMNNLAGTNIFSATQPTITFSGRLQKPFRGERLLVSTVRTGVTAVGRLLGQIFVGTDLQQLQITAFDIEQVGSPNAFGVRLTMTPAQPGVDISIVTNLSSGLTAPDTILVSCTLLGRLVH